MQKHWYVFFFCIFAGLGVLYFFSGDEAELTDVPTHIPNRTAIVPPGTAAPGILRTSDESRIPEMLTPTPLIRSSTDKLMSQTCEHGTDLCKLQAIYDFVRTNYEYRTQSPEHAHIQTPSETLLYGSGDAMELAMLMASMQRASGFQNEILRGPYNTFLRVHRGNQTIMIDPTCQGCRIMDARVQLSGNEDIFK